MEEEKISFKKLNIYMKLGIIGGWVALIIYSLSFLIAFISALIGY